MFKVKQPDEKISFREVYGSNNLFNITLPATMIKSRPQFRIALTTE